MQPITSAQVKPNRRTAQDLRMDKSMFFMFSCEPNLAALGKALAALNKRNADLMIRCSQPPRPLIFDLGGEPPLGEPILLPQKELEVIILISTDGKKGQDLTYNNKPLHFLQFSGGKLHLYSENTASAFSRY